MDKCFIRNIFSVLEGGNFDIEVVEFSIRKSTTFNNQVSFSPYNEEFNENGNEMSLNNECNERCKDSSFKKNGIRSELGSGNSSTVETQRRYINIEDITEMKNNSFYHNLIKKLDKYLQNNEKIVIEEGFIEKNNNRELKIEDKNYDFFEINDKYVWYNKNLLDDNIDLLINMMCKIRVIGYRMNCIDSKKNVIKAIAIFLE